MKAVMIQLWIAWILVVIGSLAVTLNYRLLKKEGFEKRELLMKLLNPFRIPKVKDKQLNSGDKLIIWSTTLATAFWTAFPFIVGFA